MSSDRIPLSSLGKSSLADLLGTVNAEKKKLDELEKRIKAQLQKKTDERVIYGHLFTIDFCPTTRSDFNKKRFIADYGQKIYDSYVDKKPTTRTNISNVENSTHPKHENILRVSVDGFGEISAGQLI